MKNEPTEETRDVPRSGVDAGGGVRIRTADVPGPETEADRVLHELLARNVELEMENEELREACVELEDNASGLAELYDFAPVGYFSLTSKGRIRQLNFIGARLLGQQREHLIGVSFLDFVAMQDRTSFSDFLEELFEHETMVPCELTLTRAGMAPAIVTLTGAISSDGGICRIAAIDVTKQRNLETIAREKSEDIDRIFHLSHDLLGIAGMDGRFQLVNPAFERLLGYRKEVITGCSFLEFVHPDDLETTRQAMKQLEQGQELEDFVNRYRCRDGTYRWLEWRATPYGNERICTVARDITERKAAGEARRESEERLRLFIEHAPAAMAMFDREMRYVAASNRWKQDYGLSDDVIGRSHYEIFPDIPAHWKEVHRRALAGETLSAEEDPFHRANGTVQWLNWEVHPWLLPNGGVGGTLIGSQDITARVLDREALTSSERRLRLAIDAAQMGSWEWDMQANEVFWTPHHEILLGYEPGTPRRCYQDFQKRLHPEDVERVESALRAAVEQDVEYACDFRVVRPDGSIRWVSARGCLVHDSKGQPVRMLGMIMDITARKEAEEALRVSEEKFRSIVESSPTAIYLYRLDENDRLVLTDANPAADKELVVDHCALIGKTLEEAFPKLVGTEVPMTYRSVARGDLGTQMFEIGYDDGRISGYYEVRVFRTGPGTIAVMFSDISDRMASRKAQMRAQDDLEARVLRRTAQLQMRTRQLRALAGELTHVEERERRRIAGLIHDDLQQMLVAAAMNLGMLKSKLSDQGVNEDFDQITTILRDSIRTARSLTAELSPPVLDTCGLAASLKWLRTWFGEKYAMDVEVDADDGVDPCKEVCVTLFRCVRELLFNTFKHSGVDSASVRMWRASDVALKIEVSDKGCGFDPAEIQAREGDAGGGFGLFSIRERLDWMGGAFEIESSPGRGCRFTLLAPLSIPARLQLIPEALTSVTKPAPGIVAVSATSGTPSNGQSVRTTRILIADDHSTVRDGLFQVLTREGDFEVVGLAADGREALKLARQLRPHFVIMDVNMPGMDGIQATAAIRAELPCVKIVGLSAGADAEHRAAMIRAGALELLSKHSVTSKLVATLRSHSEVSGCPAGAAD